MKKILLADDEKDILEFLQYNLEKEGFAVITAANGEEALSLLIENPDLAILDIMMPKLNGFEVCAKIRENKKTAALPVIFLTAKSSEQDEIKGLELGANDFILKPISPLKLIARVKANLRKAASVLHDGGILSNGSITIDREKYKIFLENEETFFPRKEYELLSYLCENSGKILTRVAILQNVWGSDIYVVDRTIDVHIRKIREKLGSHADMIETIKGVGYRMKNAS
ncbi:MAG: DNA-binding response regulator [Ignavibacteria bacterium CG22_combo_CG10-13_8_21_14_all_37_15]|nr:response regulator transcription factor [Ignavibacteria bacterium]PIP78765.1 MAG: DNA-binding response regulator [Ignavibacteria bacterium CG22_combo_CG10-13_8_21_14_all_37_15]PIS45374.1 MAG: DNA-binding response regulator [Ignavibacteria bacterium CG08_land_8_20_14_0_20_37_9]PIX93564.1 MAG: DNA-binding response regulator [Ignavibacteria bacterium CG_4_10_14_3_um_filter_37_18]PJC57961.1 MAG: DNA-binding response regulator [Ignavibacteria bacterium CG_4_9_14_0_2_um_filter_37_13]